MFNISRTINLFSIGKIHIRLLKEIKAFELIGFYDPNEDSAELVKEELGIDLIINRMLCVDYNSPDDQRTESLMFIFHGVYAPFSPI